MEDETNATRLIMHEYRRQKNVLPLKDWRRKIPADVRKIWIRSFALQKLQGGLIEESMLFNSIIEKSLSHSDREKFRLLCTRINDLKKEREKNQDITGCDKHSEKYDYEDDDFEEDMLSDLEFFMDQKVNDSMVEEYAKQYFLTFDFNPENMRKHFMLQDEIVKNVADMFSYVMRNDGQSNFSDICESIIVCGSAAIGPRGKNFSYPRKQDTDLLFIPRSVDILDRRMLEQLTNFINVSRSLYEERLNYFQNDNFPLLEGYFQFFSKEKNEIDVHVFTDLSREDDWGWIKLCGPHRVMDVFFRGELPQYRECLSESIKMARVRTCKNV